ncbi:MAG TPA: DNA-protecting protein DprA [Ruminococcus sp.]|nr:DNA-protecting protein DprA [Ruminococcus sp.]
MNENYAFLLWLEMIFGIANPKISAMIQKYGDARTLYYVLHDPETKLMDEKEKKCFSDTPIEKAHQVIEYCERNYIHIMSMEDSEYPEGLQHIYNAPLILFYRGNPELLRKGHILTVVGTRRPSQYSQRISKRLCYELADAGLILVSGCAVGMDASAHQASIQAGVPTVGVLGCGVDYDYPKENRMLKEQIVQNGLLVSEYFPATPPYPANFPVRNRILSGISEGVLVLEAHRKSGALITANLACEQGKYVFCIPPADIYDKRYDGQANLLRDGAYPVFHCRDIIDTLNSFHFMEEPEFPEILPDEPPKIQLPEERPEEPKIQKYLSVMPEVIKEGISFGKIPESLSSPVFDEPETEKLEFHSETVPETVLLPEQSKPEQEDDFTPVSDSGEQEQILNLIRNEGAQNIDSVCMKLGIPFHQASLLMVEMELMGLIAISERDLYVLSSGEN